MSKDDQWKLSKVVYGIEESFKQKIYTLTMCIEIQGALDNVRTHTYPIIRQFPSGLDTISLRKIFQHYSCAIPP